MQKIRKIKEEYSSADNPLLYQRQGFAKVLFGIIFAFFFIYTLSLILPFIWVFISAFKEGMEFADIMRSPFDLPEKWLFSNWSLCFKVLKIKDTGFVGMIFNSIWYVAIGGAIGLLFETATSYVLSKYSQFKISRIMYLLVIFFMTFPVMGKTSAAYKFVYSIGLGDNPLYVVIFSMSGFGSNFLILCASWDGIDDSYAEAAKIDGAGHYTIFFRIMFPMVKGPLIALGILAFIARWNAYDQILLYLPSYPTLATGLYLFQSVTTRMTNIPVYFCGVILSILPTLIIFCIFSDTIMQSVTQGGLKG